MRARAAGLILFLSVLLPAHAENGVDRSSLKTVAGVVTAMEQVPGEGGIEILHVTLGEIDGTGTLSILLAPAEALESIGFQIREGDRLKLKCFSDDPGPARAHKVMNVSRGTMIRVRTLRQIPLWDNQGRWRGGAARPQSGHGGSQYQGGRN